METGLLEVMEQVTLYLKEHLPGYTVLKVRKRSEEHTSELQSH